MAPPARVLLALLRHGLISVAREPATRAVFVARWQAQRLPIHQSASF